MAAQNNSLGFAGPPARTRVAVAMSGGVDSSVTAAMLHAEGYEVVGITLQLYDHGAAVSRPGACCAGQDIRDARRVAERAGFPHYVLDYESRFRQNVIDDFADSYLRGETPLPCVRCNQTVKFTDLLQTARDLDADCLATGHYVRRVEGGRRAGVAQGCRPGQGPELFHVRHHARAARLPALSPRRQAEGGNPPHRPGARRAGGGEAGQPGYLLRAERRLCAGGREAAAGRLRSGPDRRSRTVQRARRTHDGIIRFTVGQRRGLGIGGMAEPLYVVRIDAGTNDVVVGPREALARHTIAVVRLNWLGDGVHGDGAPEGRTVRAEARIRNAGEAKPCQAEVEPDGRATLTFDDPQYGVSAGQAAVLYDGTRVLGGGWIGRA